MQHLLNLLAAIALLVWGTHMVRTGVLRVMGGKLRDVLAKGMSHKGLGLLAGMGVSSALQSSTATCLIVSAFVGQGLLSTSAALVMMLGADVGTSLMALFFSLDLSWLSPLPFTVVRTQSEPTTRPRANTAGLLRLSLSPPPLARRWALRCSFCS